MRPPTESYRKVAYDIRPAKQVERRMMFDALQILSRNGFDIGDYQYTGFGSIFFVDFLLFHRYLGMRRLVNVEHNQSIRKRIKFNRPFGLIELRFASAAEVIPDLDRDLRHVLWLDYDDYINREMIRDFATALETLPVGSIVLITVDANPPLKNASLRDIRSYFEEQAREYLNPRWKTADFGLSKLVSINNHILRGVVTGVFAYRSNARYLPLFSFSYADGHEMLTIGGVIGADAEERDLNHCDFSASPYVRRRLGGEPYRIELPILTKKERIYLDAAMPSRRGWSPSHFELSVTEVDKYREMYRFAPSFAELF